jgi:hypothetical protein
MNVKNLILLFALGIGITLSSCNKDDDDVANPENPNDNELITTVQIVLTDTANSSDQIKVSFSQMPAQRIAVTPYVETMQLKANSVYYAEVLLLDETKNPVDTISNEVREEGNEHQLFYKVEYADLTIDYNDADDNGVPIGLNTLFKTGETSTGVLRITLKHQGDEKPKSGSGNELLGSTDVDVAFNVEIE